MADMEPLLEQWEQNYRRGLLSFWILLSMANEAQYAYGLKEEIEALSLGSITADENSLYRALRRFAKEGLIESEMRPSDQGPDRRYFELSAKGRRLLAKFIQRNLTVFEDPEMQSTMARVAQSYKEHTRSNHA